MIDPIPADKLIETIHYHGWTARVYACSLPFGWYSLKITHPHMRLRASWTDWGGFKTLNAARISARRAVNGNIEDAYYTLGIKGIYEFET